VEPELQFVVLDASSNSLQLPWIHLTLNSGDGTLVDDSVRPTGGFAETSYNFSGSDLAATIRAVVRDVDTVEAYVRASTIVPGERGQVIRLDDIYETVKQYNAEPDTVDEDPYDWFHYAVYESSLGVVAIIDDSNFNHLADTYEPVYGVIVNTIYAGTTAEGVGIGTSYPVLTAAYGPPDSSAWWDIYPNDTILYYYDLGLTIWANRADTVINEIHVVPPRGSGVAGPVLRDRRGKTMEPSVLSNRKYRLLGR
jgi:hypothetical protein